ncbi:uncharacterized protein B0I36DRAFT_156625 [Microdochium trichocladiopsis]|uniref:Uncharacterized protein n=1 Tax=Microdochium trichocladiopsis TaxID=1682393 RepID=A0A9P8XZ04_9PEZI|nr:uncharacterized protein B0I36DRAFT_156625 [Microdochium trichocladiopsis]KAH7026310.1 hypothetical protein B0I36DRAFT_156625 [Microdochium trichocladiopsis]
MTSALKHPGGRGTVLLLLLLLLSTGRKMAFSPSKSEPQIDALWSLSGPGSVRSGLAQILRSLPSLAPWSWLLSVLITLIQGVSGS